MRAIIKNKFMKNYYKFFILLIVVFFIIPSIVSADILTPVVTGVTPVGNVVPGITKICVNGKNFGTSAEGWTTNSSITVGAIKITKALWTDNSICFIAPNGLPYGGIMMSVLLHINNGSTSIDGGGNIITLGGVFDNSLILNDTYIKKQYYLYNIHAFDGWSIQPNGNNVVVAVID